MFRLARLARRSDEQRNTRTDRREGGGNVTEESVIAALKTVFDPEIPVNIFDLGLIYDLEIDTDGSVDIRMTLTAPACPVAEILPLQVKKAVQEFSGANRVDVELVWDPPWSRERMSDAARLQLGLD